MKDLLQYFSAANDIVNCPRQTTETRAYKNGNKQSTSTPKSKKRGSKIQTPRGKKKISPSSSPLEGFNILFNSVLKQSPENKATISKMENTSTEEIGDSNSRCSEDSILLCADSVCTNSNKVKMNAFQVLMDSRNKVIGSNSPGKEMGLQENSQGESPPNLSARKRLLHSWSDSIKAKKRKLNDVEIDKYIKVKLNKRKERLKTLLNIEDESAHEATSTPKSKSKKNSTKKVRNSEGNAGKKCKKSTNEIKSDVDKSKPEMILNNKSMNSEDDFEQCSTPRTSMINNENKIHKESLNDSFTPKSRWKMKIKLICDNLDNEDINNSSLGNEDVTVLDDKHLPEVDDSVNKRECKVEESQTEYNGVLAPDEEKTIIEESNTYKRVLRNRTSLNKNRNMNYVYLSEDSDDEVKQKRSQTNAKVAPVFAKAIPKPKIDPEVLEARRKFLMSDMPDVLRKRFDKQTSNSQKVDIDFDVFPKISHVYQIDKDNPIWNLPSQNLPIKPEISLVFQSANLLCRSLIDKSILKRSRYQDSVPIENAKLIMRGIKEINPNYPVYKVFRLLSEKNGLKTEGTLKTIPKKGRKQRNSSEKKQSCPKDAESQIDPKFKMWTEKYKPRSSEDFLNNTQAVSAIKKWLEKWKEILDSGKKRKKHQSSDSDAEFVSSDAESVSERSISTLLVLSGPCGSGKSSSVYAICNELGLNVLEVNASSRRTGKLILQELQEATQSHQVRKNKGGLDSFTNGGQSSKKSENDQSRRMCVLLIEDIDIVFDQDEGFIHAISQISSTSKRPIILTTTNEDSVFAQKFISDFKTIRFHSASVQRSGVWLQILCVLEGIFIDLSSICELLEYNQGDARKTLLELQYWVQSGGQNNKNKNMWDPIFEIESLVEENCPTTISDDTVDFLQYNEKFEDYRVHTNILSDFEIFQIDRFYNIPRRIDLKTLWWNIPKFLHTAKPKPTMKFPEISSKGQKKRLKMVSDLYDSVAGYDLFYRKTGYKIDDPVCRKRWHCRLKDSLEVEERNDDFPINEDLLDLNHYLTNGHLELCKKRFIYEHYENQRLCNMAVPLLSEERRLNNDNKYEEELLKPVPFFNSLDRKSVALDYLPCLRTIARTENIRSENNVKRHNRFFNYLQNLNINCDTAILNFAIQTFSVK